MRYGQPDRYAGNGGSARNPRRLGQIERPDGLEGYPQPLGGILSGHREKEGEVLPLYVLSRNYDPRTEAFELLIAGNFVAPPLAAFTLEAGLYARITVRPKLGFLWGPAVGEAKRYFYTKWLPGSGYAARNLEYELHTEKSVGKAPSIDLLFAVRGKD